MYPRTYSAFWLAWAAGRVCLSEAWEGRDLPVKRTAEHPAEGMPMGAWLRMEDSKRADIVEQYSGFRPPLNKARNI